MAERQAELGGPDGEVAGDPASGRRRRTSPRTTAGAWPAIAAKTRVVMQEFLTRATERKIDRLSDLITESFRFLLRKQTMVERIHIDPSTFAITLFNEAGHALPRERLSEGEKQIFAISVLWGLARARPIRCRRSSTRPWPGSTPPTGGTWSSAISRTRATRS